MGEIAKCIGIISSTVKLLKLLRFMLFAVLGVFLFRIATAVFRAVKPSAKW